MSRFLVSVLCCFYVSTPEASISAKVTDTNQVPCYDCKAGDFENCPAPSFGRCPPVPGPRSCPDTRSVCHLISTWDIGKGSPIGLKKTCGVEGKDDCNTTVCRCVCLQRLYTEQSASGPVDHSQPNIAAQRKKIAIQFQDRYKSYLALKPPNDIADVLHLSFDMRPASLKGFIAHFQIGKAYVSLLFRNSQIVLAFDLGSGPATIRSKTKLRTDGKWYSVTAIRKGKKGTLTVDGTKTNGYSGGSKTRFTASGKRGGKFQLLIGGGPDPVKPSSTLTGFSGCLKKLRVNNRPFEQLAKRLLKGRSVSECDKPHPCKSSKIDCGVGGACVVEYPPTDNRPYCLCARGFVYSGSSCKPGPDVCKKGYFKCYNGGTCVYNVKSVRCKCRQPYGGKQCKEKKRDMCKETKHGRPLHRCVKPQYCRYLSKTKRFRCNCPIPRIGDTCNQVLKSGHAARLTGISYAKYKPFFPSNTHSKINLEIRPERRNGLLLYLAPSNTNRQFFALGIKNALIEFVINFGSKTLIFKHHQQLGKRWYKISINRLGGKVTILLNGKQKRTFGDSGRTKLKLSVSGKSIFLGGIPIKEDMTFPPEYKTILGGRYPYGLRGCIKNFQMSSKRVDLFRSAVSGTDVSQC